MTTTRSMVMLLAMLVSCCRASVNYALVSKTLAGKPCMTTCVNGKCFIDHHMKPTQCTVDRLAGVALHPTALWKGEHRHCLSNCGKWGGYDYMWCYTTENLDWDYCNDEVITPGVYPGRDIYGSRCIDDCLAGGSSTRSRCHLATQEYTTCTTAGRIPVQSRDSIYQTPYRVSRSPLDRLFSKETCSDACRARYRDGRNGETLDRANAVYLLYNNVRNITTFPANSPYRYVATTTAYNNNNDQVLMPLIVQARLTKPSYVPRSPDDVPPEAVKNINYMYNAKRNSDRSGIQVGHIVAYMNGGVRDLYNFAGQTEQLNKGPYKSVELIINDWLRLGYVDFTAVITYTGTQPDHFYLKLTFYNADGSLHSDCQDIVLSNI